MVYISLVFVVVCLLKERGATVSVLNPISHKGALSNALNSHPNSVLKFVESQLMEGGHDENREHTSGESWGYGEAGGGAKERRHDLSGREGSKHGRENSGETGGGAEERLHDLSEGEGSRHGLENTENYCYSQDPRPYHLLATKTSYIYAQDHNITHDDLVPEGCEAQQLWHLVRHGTRYPSEEDIHLFRSHLPSLQARVSQAHQAGKGELCSGDVSLVGEWSVGDLNTSWAFRLTEAGAEEVRELASRYKTALPTLLQPPFTNESYTFRHTGAERTEASARAYSEGVFGSSATPYIPPPTHPDHLLKFWKYCPRYERNVKGNPEAVRERALFDHGLTMAELLAGVSRRLGISLQHWEIRLLYEACRYYQAWETDQPSPWCAAFTPQHLQVLEYSEDLGHYYLAGYGHTINYHMACPPLRDVFNHFRSVVSGKGGPRGIFYFTHSTALLTVMSRLGLYRDLRPLTHQSIDPDRKWRTSKHVPFASNLALTLSACPNNRWWVSVVENGRVVGVDGCGSGRGCTWEEYQQAFTPFLDCDLSAICSLDQSHNESQEEMEIRPPITSYPSTTWAQLTGWLTALFS